MHCPLCQANSESSTIHLLDHDVVVCKNCEIGSTQPPPAQLLYEQMDFHASEVVSGSTELRNFNHLPETLKSSYRININLVHEAKPATILEIGSGEGILSEQLSEHGFKVTCIEPSITACKRAKRRGLNVFQGYFPHIDVTSQFDLIIMTQVLEHIADPLTTLKQIKNQLNPQGYLLLNQTNYKSLAAKVQGAKWYAWVPHQHFWHFTPKGLVNISRDLGFKEVGCVYSHLVSLGRKEAALRSIANIYPPLKDQFHLLLQLT